MALAKREGPALGRLHFTERAIEERVGRTALVSIPRADARNLVVRRATIAERPLLFVIAGAALIAVGTWAVAAILRAGLRLPRTSVTFAFGLLAGPLLIAVGLRRGWVLEIETPRGVRKLGFGRGIGDLDVKAFVDDAASSGLFIERR